MTKKNSYTKKATKDKYQIRKKRESVCMMISREEANWRTVYEIIHC